MDAEQWTTTDVANHLGITPATVRAYAARHQMPPPDGRLGRTPWWWSTTITTWQRPGRGTPGRGWHARQTTQNGQDTT